MVGRLRGWSVWNEITGTGWIAGALGVVALGVGAWLNWTELLLLGVAFVVLTALALLVVRVPRGARYSLRVSPMRAQVGGVIHAEVGVKVGKLPLLAPQVHVPVGPDLHRLRLPIMGMGHAHREPIVVKAERRGVHLVGPVRHVQGDLLGLCRRSVAGAEAVEVFVRPHVVPLDSLAPGVVNDMEGVPSDQLSVSDLAFHALREYVPGDDLRHVHWRSSARADRLLVRQYQETRRSRAIVLVDTEASSYRSPEDFELGMSIAASVVTRAVHDDFEVSFAWGDSQVASDASHPDPLLDATCRVVPTAQGPEALRHSAVRAAAAAPGASLVVLVAGGRRNAADLSVVASCFAGEALGVVVRVDSRAKNAVAEQAGFRAITANSLDNLAALLRRSV